MSEKDRTGTGTSRMVSSVVSATGMTVVVRCPFHEECDFEFVARMKVGSGRPVDNGQALAVTIGLDETQESAMRKAFNDHVNQRPWIVYD